ncbi:MAG: hypothetical protein AB9869_20510 [Verrucomicrobiia bacterium]
MLGTLLGGSGEDDAIMGIRLDGEGRMFVAGHTKSSDFPVTRGAVQQKLGGLSDVYAAQLSPDASRLLYATYLGGSGDEFAEHRPGLTPQGELLVCGFCGSTDFPTSPGALQRAVNGPSDGFLTAIGPSGKGQEPCPEGVRRLRAFHVPGAFKARSKHVRGRGIDGLSTGFQRAWKGRKAVGIWNLRVPLSLLPRIRLLLLAARMIGLISESRSRISFSPDFAGKKRRSLRRAASSRALGDLIHRI